ncbi:DUF6668 family protein [Streptomyces sp. TRM 70361]|uniref:DUF6668 family protein n=1 Tax=Streptomyces sp. TRM 70361 TaxID=3116553 RepID=UPI002E7BA5AD|nr:DUF6668 family protein [Streptomyces sp. TRM 70361]MEE1940986.1 DUF6668 family protein [Streptomyces sp. TRM 70361]
MVGDVPVVNPWLPQPRPPGGINGKPRRSVQEASAELTGPAAPQGAGVPPPEHALPVARAGQGGGHAWWWLGAHGGAGVSTLERAVPGGRDAGRAWPTAEHEQSVVLVARSGANGLRAAQNAVQQWASGMVTGIDLLGLVVVADAPGRRPKALRDLVRLVSGAVPRLWEIPWVEPWRLGEPPLAHLPRECAPLARDLTGLTRPV